MIKISITGKADKRILTYPFIRACSIAGRTSVITDDVAYKRLYAGKDSNGEIEGIKINILPTLSSENMIDMEELAIKEDIEYLIIISDSYYCKDSAHILMLCEHNCTFLGNYIEDIIEEQNNITFGMLTLEPRKYKNILPKDVQMHQIIWKPEHSLYLLKIEERRKLLPLRDKAISTLLVNAFATPLNLKPTSFLDLLRRKKYVCSKKENRKDK